MVLYFPTYQRARFCISPLDVLKIRLQLEARSPDHGPRPHIGTFSTLTSILRNEGVTALWKGNVPAELMYLTYGGAQFAGYRTVSRAMDSLPGTLPASLQSFVSGAAAGAIATTITYPLDLLRTRFAAQGQQRVYVSLRTSLREITRHEGLRGFYRGLDAGIIQIVPYMGLFFAFYEAARPFVAKTQIPLQGLGSGDALAGVMASVAAKTAVFPLDTVRKRLQVQGPTRESYAYRGIPRYESGVLGTLRTIAAAEGLKGLYKGLTVGLLKAAPASAITMWTYERALAALQDWSDE